MGWLTRKLNYKYKSRGTHRKNSKLMQPYRRTERLGWAALDEQVALDILKRINGLK